MMDEEPAFHWWHLAYKEYHCKCCWQLHPFCHPCERTPHPISALCPSTSPTFKLLVSHLFASSKPLLYPLTPHHHPPPQTRSNATSQKFVPKLLHISLFLLITETNATTDILSSWLSVYVVGAYVWVCVWKRERDRERGVGWECVPAHNANHTPQGLSRESPEHTEACHKHTYTPTIPIPSGIIIIIEEAIILGFASPICERSISNYWDVFKFMAYIFTPRLPRLHGNKGWCVYTNWSRRFHWTIGDTHSSKQILPIVRWIKYTTLEEIVVIAMTQSIIQLYY